MHTTYAYWNSRLQGRCERQRKIHNNTYAKRELAYDIRGRLIAVPNGDIYIRYHNTDIITYHADGSVTMTTGGWATSSTRARLNEFSPYVIWSKNRKWWIGYVSRKLRFRNGIRLAHRVAIEGAIVDIVEAGSDLVETAKSSYVPIDQPRCWATNKNGKLCGLFVSSWTLECARHGKLDLPGHEQEYEN